MTTLSQFVGGGALGKTPTSIFNSISTALGSGTENIAGGVGAKKILAGAQTAATLKTLLSITGGGVISYLAAFTEDATARTLRLKITLDGAVVFDSTSSSVSSVIGFPAIGFATWNSVVASSQSGAVPFNKSLLIEVASSLTETDKTSIEIKYWTV